MTYTVECQATPQHELIRQLMDSRVPKTEREHAAAREIDRLRGLLRESRLLYCELLNDVRMPADTADVVRDLRNRIDAALGNEP